MGRKGDGETRRQEDKEMGRHGDEEIGRILNEDFGAVCSALIYWGRKRRTSAVNADAT